MSTGFLGAGDTRQLILRAERQREQQLASLFYKTAGGRPNMDRMIPTRRARPHATKSGDQPFAGVRQLQRKRKAQSKRSKRKQNDTRSLSVSKSRSRTIHASQSLPVLDNPNTDMTMTTLTAATSIDTGGSALDDFAEAALASTDDDINVHATSVSPERVWEAHQANDGALHRFTQLGNAEASMRVPPQIDQRDPVADGYKTYNQNEEYSAQTGTTQQSVETYEDKRYDVGGHVHTIGGVNLPIVSTSSGVLPIISLNELSIGGGGGGGGINATNSSNDNNNKQQQHDDAIEYYDELQQNNGRSPVSKLYKDLQGQQHLNGIPSQPRPKSRSGSPPPRGSMKRRSGPPPIVNMMNSSSAGVLEHQMHYGGGGRRVHPDTYSKMNDRVAGILLLRTEKLENEIIKNKDNEQKLLTSIHNNIEYSRRSLLPLDFVFRKALVRFKQSFLKNAMSKWLSFVLRSRTIEKLLLKVEPYCIKIQKRWRGVLGRKRVAIIREIMHVERIQRRLGACTALQLWWKRQSLKMNIKNRFIHNVARRRLLAAYLIQKIWTGFKGREKARARYRSIHLASAMTELIKYRHTLSDSDQLEIMKLSSILFDQRSDSFGDGEHKRPYTMLELKKSVQKSISLRDKRRNKIKKKKEKWSKDAAERRLEIRYNLKMNEKKKFEDRIQKEREKLLKIEQDRLAEIERIKQKRIELERKEKERQEKKEQMEKDELEKITRIKEDQRREKEMEMNEINHREIIEQEKIQLLHNEKHAAEHAHSSRMEEQQHALALHQAEDQNENVDVDVVAPKRDANDEIILGENVDTQATNGKEVEQSSINSKDTHPVIEETAAAAVKDFAAENVRIETIAPPLMTIDVTVSTTAATLAAEAALPISKESPQKVDKGTEGTEVTEVTEVTAQAGIIVEAAVVEAAIDTSVSSNIINSTTDPEEDEQVNNDPTEAENIDEDTANDVELLPVATIEKVRRGGGDLFSIQAIEDYQADPDRRDEIDLIKGDQITVHDRDDPDWWVVKNKRSGKIGTVPAASIARRGVEVRPRENYPPKEEEEDEYDEKLMFEFGDYIEVLDWEDPDWWRGRNMSNGKTGEFPSDLVYLPSEWIEEQLRVRLEFDKEEESLKAQEMEKLEKFTRGLAADGMNTKDGRNALRTIFALMDYNSNGTIERYDIIKSISMDGSRLEAIVELGLGKLRYWLSPSKWYKLYMLMEYEQSLIDERKSKKDTEEREENKRRKHKETGAALSSNNNLAATVVLLDDAVTSSKFVPQKRDLVEAAVPMVTVTEKEKTIEIKEKEETTIITTTKKRKKILPHHEHGGGVGFNAFAVCVSNPAASLARWEQHQAKRRLALTHEKATTTATLIMNDAMNLVDPPSERLKREVGREKRKVQQRNEMMIAGAALIKTANGAGDAEDARSDEVLLDKATMNAKLEQRLNISTTRAKLLHFLAVARIPKMELVARHPILKRLLAMDDGIGGSAPQAEVLRPLLVSNGESDIVDVRRLMPVLGWDARVDIITMNRVSGFEEDTDKTMETMETVVQKKEEMPRGNPVDVVRQLREKK